MKILSMRLMLYTFSLSLLLVAGTSSSASCQPFTSVSASTTREFTLAPPPDATYTLDDPQELETFIDAMMDSQMEEQHIAGVVVAVVKDGQILLSKGYGYADIENRSPVDPETTLFRPGSVTKLFTWTAVMQLVEQGKIDLLADVNMYLTRFQIPATYPQPISMLDLMAHTAGFEEREKNLFKDSVDEMTSLEDYLVQNMPARVFPPGKIPAYSNYGTALAGYIVEQVSGESYEQYIEEHIFKPLGMEHSTMIQPLPDALAPDMSQGYSFSSGYQAEEFEFVQAGPAGALSASGLDMGKFMLAHLQDGEYNNVQILKAETAKLMHSQSYTFDPALPGMAHGFMEFFVNGQRLIWHGGDTYQFHTLLALLPEEQTGIYFSYNSTPSPKAREAFLRAFMDRYFPSTPVPTPQPQAEFASREARYTGFYETSRMVYTSYEKVFASILAVKPGPDNMLRIPNLASFDMSDTWVEVRPLVMKNTRTGESAVFMEDENGEVQYVGIGNWPITVLIKLPWYGGPYFKFGLLGFSLLTSLFTLVAAAITPFIPLSKRGTDGNLSWFRRLARWIALLWCVLVIALSAFIILVFMDVENLTSSTSQLVLAVLPWAVALFAPIITSFAGLAWWKCWWGLVGRIHYTVIVLAVLALLWFEIYWSLL
jgi:CubicO group peptidase (beta-lactamase class C family)